MFIILYGISHAVISTYKRQRDELDSGESGEKQRGTCIVALHHVIMIPSVSNQDVNSLNKYQGLKDTLLLACSQDNYTVALTFCFPWACLSLLL